MMNRQRRVKSSAVPMRVRLIIIVIVLVIVSLWSICSESTEKEQYHKNLTKTDLGDLLEVIEPSDIESVPVNYYAYRLSFNPKLHIPNWVAWELTAAETSGSQERSSNFYTDANVVGCALPEDYRRSGYDRGHMAPAGDMKWSPTAMGETFYLTNICPQAKALNSGAWKKLEEKCRQWAKRDSAIVIICGPVISDKLTSTIGTTGVAVPKRFFKVIIAPYVDEPRGIGFIMPNMTVEGGMQACATSIDEVERITGLDFFSSLPDSIEDIIESQNNFNLWSSVPR